MATWTSGGLPPPAGTTCAIGFGIDTGGPANGMSAPGCAGSATSHRYVVSVGFRSVTTPKCSHPLVGYVAPWPRLQHSWPETNNDGAAGGVPAPTIMPGTLKRVVNCCVPASQIADHRT